MGTCEHMNPISLACGSAPGHTRPSLSPVVDAFNPRVPLDYLVIVITPMLCALQTPCEQALNLNTWLACKQACEVYVHMY